MQQTSDCDMILAHEHDLWRWMESEYFGFLIDQGLLKLSPVPERHCYHLIRSTTYPLASGQASKTQVVYDGLVPAVVAT